jgi:hypothetical protein
LSDRDLKNQEKRKSDGPHSGRGGGGITVSKASPEGHK